MGEEEKKTVETKEMEEKKVEDEKKGEEKAAKRRRKKKRKLKKLKKNLLFTCIAKAVLVKSVDVSVDFQVVKGEKADPLKVLERVQRKSHRKVELLSPIPKPPAPEEEKTEDKEKSKPEDKKEEPPAAVVTVVLKEMDIYKKLKLLFLFFEGNR
ncbi:hypothetical protein F383_13536 [Gossypium arboreum]|uniref:Uncharacterized protein n=1 Tax=Gossypium arboreum TaxID=29729 RepID=A0A0B0PYD4_GOSAR|nr:hypothetical protein F383_13536 [Gossypium arboreum]